VKYQSFLDRRSQLGTNDGFKPVFMPDFLFDFQSDLVEWAVMKGRAAIFADCGLGKTPMQLVWAENVVRKTNKPVLILTPLAVSRQTVEEAEKFDIGITRSQDGKVGKPCIVITNYERLHYFDAKDFAGVVCDESSILKSFTGATKQAVTEFMTKKPYRLLCTATAAPNDYIELGTSSEALGHLGYMDMLNRFFRNQQNNSSLGRMHGQAAQWRLKNYAELPFWRWVCSWARACRRPSDLGYDDDRFVLPELIENEHLVETEKLRDGMLFALPAVGLKEQREERRLSITERCGRIADMVETGKPALVWCHLNDEGDLLEKLIPDAKQIKGSQPDEKKEDLFTAFAHNELRVLVTKPKIGAWGLNFQHCSHVTFFPSHSFEQYYQGVRRCWRFGQKNPVTVDVVASTGERNILDNLQRKANQADDMFTNLVAEMNNPVLLARTRDFQQKESIPSWL
jgi:SNF2 family DNA or RNA helicase